MSVKMKREPYVFPGLDLSCALLEVHELEGNVNKLYEHPSTPLL